MLQYGQALGQEWGVTEEPRRHLYVIASLLRYWRLVVLCAGAALTFGILLTAFKPVTYTASTQLLIYNRELHAGPEAVISPGRADTALVENMIEILKSRNVLTKAIETLKLNEDREIGSGRSARQVLRDWVTPAPPEEISEPERAFEDLIERFRQRLSVVRAGTSHTVLVAFSASDPNKAAAVANEIAQSAARVFRGTESKTSPIRESLQGLGPSAYVISAADPPIQPDGPRRTSIVAGSLIAGLGLGVALAFLLDFRGRTIRTAEQVENMLGLECFGTVARTAKLGAAESRGTHDAGDERWPPSLAQALHRALTVMDSILMMRVLGVTSAVSGEGATTIAAGLAQAAERAGKKVLVVDLARRACCPDATASSDSEQTADLRDETRIPDEKNSEAFPRTDFSQLDNVTSVGPDSVDRLDAILQEAASAFDLVIVDLPPLSEGATIGAAAQKLDGILLVLKWGADAAEVRRALEFSAVARAKCAGVILNMATERLIGRYGDALAGAQARLTMRSRETNAPKDKTTGQEGEVAPA